MAIGIRALTTCLGFCLIALGVGDVRAERPIVVELYTSQGCHSCPPADEFLAELVKDPRVLPLSMHVTYWNRLGWADTFSNPAFDQRQVEYSRRLGQRHVFTPQAVIDGVFSATGSDRRRISAMIDQIDSMREPEPEITIDGDSLDVRGIDGPYRVILAGLTDQSNVKIERGENAGRVIDYHHIVRDWIDLGVFRGAGKVTLPFDRIDNELCNRRVILVQKQDDGRIVYADIHHL